MESTLKINTSFDVLQFEDLYDIDGGTFWGKVGGAASVVAGAASCVGGAVLLGVPEPTLVTKAAGWGAISVGATAVIGGLATIASN